MASTWPDIEPLPEAVEKWGIPQTPRQVDISITARCNLACSFCYYANDMKKGEDLPTETWLRFFDELEECRVISTTILGGEPFARKDIKTLLQSLVDHKLRFRILTNGTLMTKDMAQWLTETKRADYVQVSIDGDRELHDELRGSGSFDRAVQGVHHLLDAGVQATVRFTITRKGAYKVYDTCKLIYDMGIERFGINEVFPRGRACDNREELLLDNEAKLEGMRQMERFLDEHPNTVEDQGGGPLWRLNFIKEVEAYRERGVPIPRKTGYLSACWCAFKRIEVKHDGTYVPCNQLPGMVLGNIQTHGLEDAWLSSDRMNELRERNDIPLSEVESCKGCEYQTLCTGGCPGMVDGIEDDLVKASPHECMSGWKYILDTYESSPGSRGADAP